jgi:hypothetical protein
MALEILSHSFCQKNEKLIVTMILINFHRFYQSQNKKLWILFIRKLTNYLKTFLLFYCSVVMIQPKTIVNLILEIFTAA